MFNLLDTFIGRTPVNSHFFECPGLFYQPDEHSHDPGYGWGYVQVETGFGKAKVSEHLEVLKISQ